jgi:hypothetical protein
MAEPAARREEIEIKLGGPAALRAFVLDRRKFSASWEFIAADLLVEHGERITGEALRKWFSTSQRAAS